MKVALCISILFYAVSSFAQSNTQLEILFNANRYAEALVMAETLIQQDSANAYALEKAGAILTLQKQYEKAIPYLEKAIVVDKENTPVSAWTYTHLGVCHYYLGAKEKGIAEARKSIALNTSKNLVNYAWETLATLLLLDERYKEAEAVVQDFIKSDPISSSPYLLQGLVSREREDYSNAITAYRIAIEKDNLHSWASAWAYINIGDCLLKLKQKDSAIAYYNKALNLKATQKTGKTALHKLDSLHALAPAKEPDWIIIEHQNIIYHFQDTSEWSSQAQTFMRLHDSAYTVISAILQPSLKGKLIIKMWTDPDLAMRISGRKLGFAEPEKLICNVSPHNTIGHIMTLVLERWAWGEKIIKYTTFVSQGVAVAFDMSRDEEHRYEAARKAVSGSGFHTVLEIWDNDKISESVMFPVASAFIVYLRKQISPAEFKSIVQYQQSSSARNTIGPDRFEKIVKDFNSMIGLK